ncbi:MAG: hypothetical protein DRM99_03670 [Thermoplasmata archaeon]|mgnify:CR=1 FL=1|nr:MAG: hypothetical protein DRM99_03670 [Thermoplasmata archaeon]
MPYNPKFPKKRYYRKGCITAKKTEKQILDILKKSSTYDINYTLQTLWMMKPDRPHKNPNAKRGEMTKFGVKQLRRYEQWLNIFVKFYYFYYYQNDYNPQQKRTPIPFDVASSKLIIYMFGIPFFIKFILKYKDATNKQRIKMLMDIYVKIVKHKIPRKSWGKLYFYTKQRTLNKIIKKIKHYYKVIEAREKGRVYDYDEYKRIVRRELGLHEYFKYMAKKGARYQV